VDYLSNLNHPQREAALHTDGALLIVAGAGAGKTKTLTSRIFHLIKKGVPPEQVLAITFTNKAAGELKQRIGKLIAADRDLNLPVSAEKRPFAGTFHSLGVHILRSMGKSVGVSPRFTIFDRADSKSAMKEAVESAGLNPKQFSPELFLSIISKAKGKSLGVSRYRELASERMEEMTAEVWERYEKILNEEKALDFDDLLLKSVELLKQDAGARNRFQETWRYIHVDEYQDTNFVQYELTKILSEKHKNICAVGDADQTIYSWRGASIRNILNFKKDFPGARVILLEENYRSTKNILGIANDIIRKNNVRVPKNLFTANAEGEKIGLFSACDEEDEAAFIAAKAGKLIRNGAKPEEIAVLYRANFQSRAIESAFLDAGLPYQLIGTRFFERKEVKDVLSYLRLARNFDSRSDLKRVMNIPPRGIGKITLLKIFAGKGGELPAAMKIKFDNFKGLLKRISRASETLRPGELVKFAIAESGIGDWLKSGDEEDLERLENVKELATLALKYSALPLPDGIDKLLNDAALQSDQDELSDERGGVRLMTIHASKGLEFDTVFIVGLEDGLFPHEKMESELGPEEEEEERRLFYVALTRAKKKVILSYANIRTIFGSKKFTVPSEFLTDIDGNFLELENHPEKSLKSIYF